MLSCHQEQNVIDGKKRIVLNPSEAQKREFETVTFAEGEVWGIDVLVSSGEDGKVRGYTGAYNTPSYSTFKRLDWRSPEQQSIRRILRLHTSSR